MLGAKRQTYLIAAVACALFACTKAANGNGNTTGGLGGGTGAPGAQQPGTTTPGGGATTPGAPTNTGSGTRVSPGAGGSSGPVGGAAGSLGGGTGGSGMIAMGTGGTSSGTGGTSGGTGGSTGAAGSTPPADPTYKPPCTTKASQVIILGDSYLNWGTHTFGPDMATAAGETWRMYAVGGYSMATGGIGLIPPEFDQAVSDDPDIKAAVMDGGGNDILIPDATFNANCKDEMDPANDPVCQMIVKMALDAATALMNKMGDAGVKDIVYLFYPHVPNNTVLGGANPNASLDYALPMAKALCDAAEMRTSGKVRCHFLDLVPIFDGHPEYFAAQDVHENSMGSTAMANAVWKIMKDNCIAQKAASGCCTP
ncbi:MAG: SGNH/GDSL hydrolase family protein [Polyangiales bacterium]